MRPTHRATTLCALAALLAFTGAVVSTSPANAQAGCGAAMPDFQAALKADTADALAGYLDQHAPCFEAPARARLKALGGALPEGSGEAGKVAETAPAEPATPPLDGLAEAKADARMCAEGLALLEENMYVHPGNPAAATDTPLSWAEAYGRFESANLPACRKLGEFAEANRDDQAVADTLSAIETQEHYAKWSDYFDGGHGIVAQGSRIPNYCPGLHLIQFNCVTAPERITAASEYLREHIERFEAMGDAASSN